MKTKIYLLIVVVFLSSCTKEYIVDDIAKRLSISAIIDGNHLKIGDTIVVNQFKNPYQSISFCIDGLGNGEFIEVFDQFGTQKEDRISIDENGYPTFSKENNKFDYYLDPSNYANIYNDKDMKMSFRFKCSDGSEKWLIHPLKVKIDSTLYKSKIWINNSTYEKIPSEITLTKGDGLHLIVWMERNLSAGNYLRVVSTNYVNDQWYSTGTLTGYEDKPINSNTMQVFVPYESKFNKRKIEIQLMGRYAYSNIENLTINWK